jgi:SAM-dependent methyltransferase
MIRKNTSALMRFFLSLGLDSWAWAVRRLYVPVLKSDLVLEVGSGGNPYARSNVLLDAYESTRERHWVPLTADRPTVLGFVENLPFKDKAFDFVIASHVLEHSLDPEKFISELQRVAKAGYIEVPDALMERLNPYKDHRLEITVRNERLVITNKEGWIHDAEVVELYEASVKKYLTTELIPRRPFAFHVRFFWENTINYQILNPNVRATWSPPQQIRSANVHSLKNRIHNIVLWISKLILTQAARNKKLNIFAILRCIHCGDGTLEGESIVAKCKKCGVIYPIRGKVVVMSEGRPPDNKSVT